MKYFSVFDKKAGSFGALYASPTFGTGERSFKEAVSNQESPYFKYPEDFALYFVLEFDEISGGVSPNSPQLICEAASFVSTSFSS